MIDLGLALLSLANVHGEEMTHAAIAAWCDCAPSTILKIERLALEKLRRRGLHISEINRR